MSAWNLRPTIPADYVAILRDEGALAGDRPGGPVIVSQWGEPCRGEECRLLQDPLPAEACASGRCEALFVRRGDALERTPLERAGELLAPIDTPAEALLIARGLGYDATCEDVSPSEDGTGYVVVGRKDAGAEFFEGYCIYVPVLVQRIHVSRGGLASMGERSASRRSTACA